MLTHFKVDTKPLQRELQYALRRDNNNLPIGTGSGQFFDMLLIYSGYSRLSIRPYVE